jgi:hypothetical protein
MYLSACRARALAILARDGACSLFAVQVSRMFGEDEFSGSPIDLCMQVLAFADNLERAYRELQANDAVIPPDAVERMRRAEKETEKSPRK